MTQSVEGTPSEDPVTGLPWAAALRADALGLARDYELHAVVVRVVGLSVLMNLLGTHAPKTLLRQISRRLRRLVDPRDRLARLSANRFLIFTIREPKELDRLLDGIRREIVSVSVEVAGERVPHSATGVATLAQDDRHPDPEALLEGLVIQAEDQADHALGRPELPAAPIVQDTDAPEPDPSPPVATPEIPANVLERQRIVLNHVGIEVTASGVEAEVVVGVGDYRVRGRAVGSAEHSRAALAADAVAAALNPLLPDTHTITVQDIKLVSQVAGTVAWAVVRWQSPAGEKVLVGIASAKHDALEAVAKAVLHAVNRQLDSVRQRRPPVDPAPQPADGVV